MPGTYTYWWYEGTTNDVCVAVYPLRSITLHSCFLLHHTNYAAGSCRKANIRRPAVETLHIEQRIQQRYQAPQMTALHHERAGNRHAGMQALVVSTISTLSSTDRPGTSWSSFLATEACILPCRIFSSSCGTGIVQISGVEKSATGGR